MKYLIIAFSVVILALGLYCKSLKADLEVSEQNNKILENSIKVQDETISKLKLKIITVRYRILNLYNTYKLNTEL